MSLSRSASSFLFLFEVAAFAQVVDDAVYQVACKVRLELDVFELDSLEVAVRVVIKYQVSQHRLSRHVCHYWRLLDNDGLRRLAVSISVVKRLEPKRVSVLVNGFGKYRVFDVFEFFDSHRETHSAFRLQGRFVEPAVFEVALFAL